MKLVRRIATLVALFSAGMSTLLLVENRAPRGVYLWLPKLLAGALAPFLGLLGLISAAVGLFSGGWSALVCGGYSALAAWQYLDGTLRRPQGTMRRRFRRAFGPEWEECLMAKTASEQREAMRQRRWSWLTTEDPEPRWLRDVPFWSDPESSRTLLCDVWLPPGGIPQTGLGILYFHGSAWCLGDKDFGTRAFFRHLAAQGHVIMDAQFRLVPETNMAGMLADAKRAVAWCKANAEKYGVDPQRIVSAGFSAGGQLALLVAYTSRDRRLTPPELWGADLTMHAAVSHAGCYDLQALYDHSRQWLPIYAKLAAQDQKVCGFVYRLSDVLCRVTGNGGKSEALARKFAHLAIAGHLPSILDGTPDEVPEVYTRYSPISYAGPGVPPTFLVQGADDIAAPVDVAYELSARLHGCGVPVVNLVFPHAEHGFDLVLPRISPVAQSAQYELDRFLALL